MLEAFYFLVPIFFLVATMYACVGFGGASSYIALMVLFSIPFEIIPPAALFCNMIVAAGNTIHFWKNGHLDLKFLFPFIVLSIPCSFLGGLIPLEKTSFQLILATTLFAVGIKTVFFDKRRFDDHREGITLSWMPSAIIGGILGFAAGLTGVGGGVFLAPILYTLGWGTERKIAATASAFIVINSFFGIVGQVQKLQSLNSVLALYPLYLSVFAGGQLGSWLCNFYIPGNYLRKLTAVLVLLVSGKLMFDFLRLYSIL